MKRIILMAGLLALAGAATAQTPPPAPAPMKPVGMTLSSSDFQDGGIIPDKFTSKAYVAGQKPSANSPALNWSGAPAGTQSFALIVHDLDVQVGKGLGDNLHWMAWNIPAAATSLPQGVATIAKLPDGTQQNRWGSAPGYFYGWGGPGAPAPIYHHYVFEIWALDTRLDLPEGASRADALKAMDGHVLDKGFTVGRFHR